MVTDPRLVAIVDSNMFHSQKVSHALKSFYNIMLCNDGYKALDSMRRQTPSCVIVCDDFKPDGSYKFVSVMKSDKALKDCSVIYIASDEEDPEIEYMREIGVENIIVKPYMPSVLINEISLIISGNVEKSWEKLPELQRDALKTTAGMFRDIEDVLITGEDISFNDVKNNCQSLVDVVESNNFAEMLNGIKNHDDYTYAHSMRVATLLTLLGHAAGFKNEDQLIMSSGGLLHDVGKMTIPHNILNKPGKLTEEEFEVMKTHVPETMKYLDRSDNIPQGVRVIAEQHHEKIDGTGYPHGLKGAQLNELARMAAIVDVFSALTDRRVYKPAMQASKAYQTLEEMTDHLDQHYVKMFKGILVDTGILE